MARYGRDFGDGYARDFGSRRGRMAAYEQGRGRGYRGYGSDFRAGSGRDVRRGYDGGWGMTNLYNTVVRGGPRAARYGDNDYNPPLRGDGTYASGSRTLRGGEFGGYSGVRHGRDRGRYDIDHDTVGIHYRPGFRR
jgi:hypothetical protein